MQPVGQLTTSLALHKHVVVKTLEALQLCGACEPKVRLADATAEVEADADPPGKCIPVQGVFRWLASVRTSIAGNVLHKSVFPG